MLSFAQKDCRLLMANDDGSSLVSLSTMVVQYSRSTSWWMMDRRKSFDVNDAKDRADFSLYLIQSVNNLRKSVTAGYSSKLWAKISARVQCKTSTIPWAIYVENSDCLRNTPVPRRTFVWNTSVRNHDSILQSYGRIAIEICYETSREPMYFLRQYRKWHVHSWRIEKTCRFSEMQKWLLDIKNDFAKMPVRTDGDSAWFSDTACRIFREIFRKVEQVRYYEIVLHECNILYYKTH